MQNCPAETVATHESTARALGAGIGEPGPLRRLGSPMATAQSPKFRRVADPVVVFVVHCPARERQRYKSIAFLVTES